MYSSENKYEKDGVTPKGGARRGDAGGRSASREQDVRVPRKISAHIVTGMVTLSVTLYLLRHFLSTSGTE